MRPTNLGFRSPKEKTAEYYDPRVTYDGRMLPYLNPRHSSMPLSKRFMQYEVVARRTAAKVGPGSYNLRKGSIDKRDVPGTPIFRPYNALKDPENNGYYFIGDQVVFDPDFDKKSKRSGQQLNEGKTSRLNEISFHRDVSIRHEESLERMKNSPYLSHRKKKSKCESKS